MKRRQIWLAMAIAAAVVAGNAHSLSLPILNLVDLIDLSDSILVGTVTSVSDGIDPTYGLPYTEVTLFVEEMLQGTQSPGETYTFRQLGLLAPRLSADGTKLMPEAPPGFPRYHPGERVMLFLSPPASVTGLQSTVGLGIGKFLLNVGNAINELDNTAVFQNLSLADGLATAHDERILETTQGAVNQADFLSLVRRAVGNRWVQSCQMWNTDEGRPDCSTPPRPGRPRPSSLPHQRPSLNQIQHIN